MGKISFIFVAALLAGQVAGIGGIVGHYVFGPQVAIYGAEVVHFGFTAWAFPGAFVGIMYGIFEG